MTRLGRVAVACAVLLAAACSQRSCGRSSERAVYKLVPEPSLTFARATPKSAECPHASSTRAGRVAVAPHPLADVPDLSVVASVVDGRWPDRPPRFVDLPEGTERLVLERPSPTTGGFEIRTRAGALAFSREATSVGSHVLARPQRYYVDAGWHDWSATGDGTHASGNLNPSGELLACAMRGEEGQTLIASPQGQTPHQPHRPDFTMVTLERPFDADFLRQHVWGFTVDEPGVGAIDGAGVTALALPSGRFIVLRTSGDAEKLATLGVDVKIEPSATDLSIVPPFALLLYGGGDAGMLAAARGARSTTTRIDARRPDGSLAWRATLPFLAAQPPIDGDGCVYVVGEGIAALDMNGNTKWSSVSQLTLRAQAFADGTLAVVRGSLLEIVGRDGVVRQSFRASEDLTTYPAISSDGAVWVASAKTLYVAK